MTLRPASLADHPAITAFLRQHEASSLFPLVNLASGASQKLWCEIGTGGVCGVLAINANGFVMPQWPGVMSGLPRQF